MYSNKRNAVNGNILNLIFVLFISTIINRFKPFLTFCTCIEQQFDYIKFNILICNVGIEEKYLIPICMSKSINYLYAFKY